MFQISIGLSQLKKLKNFVNIRNNIAKKYDKLLNKKYLSTPKKTQKIFTQVFIYM